MFDWQTIVALTLVAVSAFSVVKRCLATLQGGESGCASACSGCPSASSNPAKQVPLVQIASPRSLGDR